MNPTREIDRDTNGNYTLKYQYYALYKYINADGSENINRTTFSSGGKLKNSVAFINLGIDWLIDWLLLISNIDYWL